MPSDDPDERARERVGSVLDDKWTLERLIGIGGMAAVYLGVHRNGARAAIKVLHPAYARRKDVRERFLREGYAANRVGHSGAVKVLDDDVIESGPDEGGAFLVMELLEGQSLEDRLERGPPVGEGEMLAIAGAVLDVLAAAHAAGVVHRDLKPENLFLARDREKPSAPPKIKILDFGLARVAERGAKTMAGLAIGTPSYMPPEQAAGRVQDIDARSDLFGLGATMFRVLANRTVHPAESAMAICARMAKEPAPKLRSVAPNVSAKTAAVVDRALEHRREDRWADAAAMRAAVSEAIASLGGAGVVTVESGIVEVVTEPVERPPRPAREAPPPHKATAPFLLGLLVASLAAVGAKVAYDRHFATRSPEHDATHAASLSTAATPGALDASDEPVASEAGPLDADVGDAEDSDDASEEADASDDASAVADADVDGGEEADASATDAAAGVTVRVDAGGKARHHDAPHHRHTVVHHRRRRTR